MTGKRTILALAACGGLLLAACGDDDGRSRDEVIDQLVEDGESQESAECIVDELGAGRVDDLLDAGNDADISDEDAEEIVGVAMECSGLGDIDGGELDGAGGAEMDGAVEE